jgi:small subunit ribosomal protein S6
MRDYEVVFILQADLDEATTTGIIEKVSSWIKDSGGSIEKVENWGKRRMAYSIRKQREGHYVLVKAQMLPSFVGELERNLQFQEPVLRFLITANE